MTSGVRGGKQIGSGLGSEDGSSNGHHEKEALMQLLAHVTGNGGVGGGGLVPVLRWKFDEMFFRWMALNETVEYMGQIAEKVKSNEDPSTVSWPSISPEDSSTLLASSVALSQSHASSSTTIGQSGTHSYPITNGATSNHHHHHHQSSLSATPTPPAIASPRNSTSRHGKKGSYSPRSSHGSSANQSANKVLSPRRSDEQIANSTLTALNSTSTSTAASSASQSTNFTVANSSSICSPSTSALNSSSSSSPSSSQQVVNKASSNVTIAEQTLSSPSVTIGGSASSPTVPLFDNSSVFSAPTAPGEPNANLSLPANSSSTTVPPSPPQLQQQLSTSSTVSSSETGLSSSNANNSIPQFYFPRGVPQSNVAIQLVASQLRDAFEKLPNRKANRTNIQSIMRVIGLPLYTRIPLLTKCKVSDPQNGMVSADTFISAWKSVISDAHDVESRFVKVVSRSGNCDYLLPGDFESMLQDVVDTHKGLLFLQEAKEFHSRYITTVIARIFYNVNRSWSGRLTVQEIRNSNLLQTFDQLQQEEDINRIRDFFSYEHFYVIYCKFWDLDLDRDLLVSHGDLCKHESHSVSQKAIDRIFQGTVSKELTSRSMKMSYNDFVWFLISEEDKQSPTSVEYWFRIMDLDGDGVLSMYELQYFWDEQLQRMVQQDFADLLPFEDILCEMLDLVKPANPSKITLSDLKKCKLTHVFLNTFVNFKKFLDIQQRQNVGFYRDEEESGLTDWERYANEEYERLVSEEGGDQESYMSYEDDFEPSAGEISAPTTSQTTATNNFSMSAMNSTDVTRLTSSEPQQHNYVIGTTNELNIGKEELDYDNRQKAKSTPGAILNYDSIESGNAEKFIDKLDLEVLNLGSS